MSLKFATKTSMSYYDLVAWISENSQLVNCRIDNVYSTVIPNVFVFKLHCPQGIKELIIEPGRRIHFTKYEREKTFDTKARILREYVRDASIRSISIVNDERILRIDLSNGNSIYVELLPRGLLVVADQQNRVLFSTEYREFKDRTIRPGHQYSEPPKPTMDVKEIEKNLQKGNLSRVLGAPQDIISYLGIQVNSLSELEEAKRKLKEFEEQLKNGRVTPCYSENNVLPIRFENCVEAKSFNDALDEYFTKLEKVEAVKRKSEKVEEEKKRLESSINQLLSTIEEYKKEEEKLRTIGRLIMSNYQLVEDEIKRNAKRFTLKLDGYEVELDPKLSAMKNASKYFDEAKEYSQKAKRAEETLEELKKKLQSLSAEIEEKSRESAISFRKKEWYEKYRWSFTRHGYLVIAGKDQDQNESIVRKLLGERDIFLHADIQGAAATVIKDPEGIQEEDIRDAAVIAACYSKAWKVGLGSVDVFWVYGSQVSKSPPAGEYLPKGSFMIYGKKNFVNNVKLELAIGVCKGENEVRVEAGPVDAISEKCDAYAVIAPGGTDPSKVAEKIARDFSKKLELPAKVIANEIAKLMPGRSEIKKVEVKSVASTNNNNPISH